MRMPLILSPEELRQLDDWQFTHRHRTPTVVLKALMQVAIKMMSATAMPKAGKAKKPEGST